MTEREIFEKSRELYQAQAFTASRAKQKAWIDALNAVLDYYGEAPEGYENSLTWLASRDTAKDDSETRAKADALIQGLKYGKRLLGDGFDGNPRLRRVVYLIALAVAQ